MTDVLLATSAALPGLEPEDGPLLAALRERGVDARIGVWSDPTVDWGSAKLVVIRSTWDYHLHWPAFQAWAGRVAGLTRLLNPLALVRWNGHKGYLRDLSARGLPTIPTVWAEAPLDLGAVFEERGWRELVVKPLVSASAHRTLRVRPHEAPAARAHLDALVADGGALVQPYLERVEGEGERALVFLDGQLSHAVRKTPALLAGVTDPNAYEVVAIAGDEAALAHRVLSPWPDLLYARVDLVRQQDGSLALMELELIEPSLYLTRVPGAGDRLAAGIQRRL